jgi:hypothetical protein
MVVMMMILSQLHWSLRLPGASGIIGLQLRDSVRNGIEQFSVTCSPADRI